jgi:hypothetical protein
MVAAARRYYEKNREKVKERARLAAIERRARGLDKATVRRRALRRRLAMDKLKSRPCHDCGRVFPPYVMDWDHRDPSQKRFVVGGSNRLRNWKDLVAETEKCDLVCSNCHRIRTHKRGYRGQTEETKTFDRQVLDATPLPIVWV